MGGEDELEWGARTFCSLCLHKALFELELASWWNIPTVGGELGLLRYAMGSKLWGGEVDVVEWNPGWSGGGTVGTLTFSGADAGSPAFIEDVYGWATRGIWLTGAS